MDLIDIYRTFHPNPAEPGLFSGSVGLFPPKIYHILGNQENPDEQSILSDHSGTQLQINSRKSNRAFRNSHIEEHTVEWQICQWRDKEGNEEIPQNE